MNNIYGQNNSGASMMMMTVNDPNHINNIQGYNSNANCVTVSGTIVSVPYTTPQMPMSNFPVYQPANSAINPQQFHHHSPAPTNYGSQQYQQQTIIQPNTSQHFHQHSPVVSTHNSQLPYQQYPSAIQQNTTQPTIQYQHTSTIQPNIVQQYQQPQIIQPATQQYQYQHPQIIQPVTQQFPLPPPSITQQYQVAPMIQPVAKHYQHPPIYPFQPPTVAPVYIAPSTQALIKSVVLFENERYSPMSGWSAKGLLPNDRKAISTANGDSSWANMKEAETAFLSHGWRWRENSQWELDTNHFSNADGWLYSSDFASLNKEGSSGGSHKKGMGHFVRRRRHYRDLIFDAAFIGDGINNGSSTSKETLTCDFCDLNEVDQLSASLLTIFVTLSLLMYPGVFRVEKVSKIKVILMEALEVTPGRRANQYSYNEVMGKLNGLCGRTSQKSSIFQKNSESVAVRGANAVTLFCETERRHWARFLIRKTDYSNQYHCARQNCGATGGCEFAVCGCANSGCVERFSQKWLPGHDAVCPFKIVACSNGCGEGARRLDQQQHVVCSCVLRLVQCTFFEMGCTNPLAFRDLSLHCGDCVPQHLAMATNKLAELAFVNQQKQAEVQVLSTQHSYAKANYMRRHNRSGYHNNNSNSNDNGNSNNDGYYNSGDGHGGHGGHHGHDGGGGGYDGGGGGYDGGGGDGGGGDCGGGGDGGGGDGGGGGD